MLGHVPMFLDTEICEISKLIGEVALKCSENKIKELEKIYWFTIEFGLIKESLECKEVDSEGFNSEVKIYGAGILSSFGEINKIVNQNVSYNSFDIQKIISDKPLITQMQNNYYCIESFSDLKNQITKYLLNYLE
jgi:phenylalanine-4-hydroxylase